MSGCVHCLDIKLPMQFHCDNSACNWVVCMNCRRINVIKKELGGV